MADESVERRLAAIERRLAALEGCGSGAGSAAGDASGPAVAETAGPAAGEAAGPAAAEAAVPPVVRPGAAGPTAGPGPSAGPRHTGTGAIAGPGPTAAGPTPTTTGAVPPAAGPPPTARAPARRPGSPFSAALVLGWSGAAALVLAAAYLVRLSIVYGWLTPARQVGAAAVAGVALLAAGALLRLRDRSYAGLLSAAGVAVLYLTVYGAHLHHRLIGAPTATALVVAVAAASLGLHVLFRGGPFVAFALGGSYSAPLLIPGEGTLLDLALYLTVWNVVYGLAALRLGSRAVYLVALYASLLVFDAAWSAGSAAGAWETAALFQFFQFVFFGGVVTAYSIRWKRPMEGPAQALLHGFALLLLYGLEWRILDRHAPDLAPWVAVGFVAALYGAWLAARRGTGAGHGTSLLVVHAFGALVLVHAVWWEGIAREWRPLAALTAAVALWALPRVAPRLRPGWIPWTAAAIALLVLGWGLLIGNWLGSEADVVLSRPVAGAALLALWPAALYGLYLQRPPRADWWTQRALTLSAAHLAALVGSALLVDHWLGDPDTTIERLWLSLAWGALAVGWLAASIPREDRMLARSTLAIFALFAGKVLLFDLQGEESLVRVGVLAVLGGALYAGGWFYRRVLPAPPVPGS